jgi:hypothetical protein
LVDFLPVVVADCGIMTPKAFPAKAAFAAGGRSAGFWQGGIHGLM